MSFRIVLKDKVFTSLEEFGRNIYLYEEESAKLLVSKKFLNILQNEDKDKFDELIELNHTVRNADAFIFFAQYIFCPHMELKHHSYSFKDIKELGEMILRFGPTIDVYLKDFIEHKFVSFYMQKNGLDKSKPNIYEKVVQVELDYTKNPNKNYFLLGFILSECDKIIYDGKEYASEKEFFEAMVSDYYIARFSSILEKNQYVYAWLTYRGKERILNQYKSFIDTIKQVEVEYE